MYIILLPVSRKGFLISYTNNERNKASKANKYTDTNSLYSYLYSIYTLSILERIPLVRIVLQRGTMSGLFPSPRPEVMHKGRPSSEPRLYTSIGTSMPSQALVVLLTHFHCKLCRYFTNYLRLKMNNIGCFQLLKVALSGGDRKMESTTKYR